MNLSAPKQITWLIAVIVGVLGILGKVVAIPFISAYAFWLVVVAFLILVVGTFMDGV